jgi:hypothetical protein
MPDRSSSSPRIRPTPSCVALVCPAARALRTSADLLTPMRRCVQGRIGAQPAGEDSPGTLQQILGRPGRPHPTRAESAGARSTDPPSVCLLPRICWSGLGASAAAPLNTGRVGTSVSLAPAEDLLEWARSLRRGPLNTGRAGTSVSLAHAEDLLEWARSLRRRPLNTGRAGTSVSLPPAEDLLEWARSLCRRPGWRPGRATALQKLLGRTGRPHPGRRIWRARAHSKFRFRPVRWRHSSQHRAIVPPGRWSDRG